MEVYGAMWCSCIYESDYTPMSLHKTKRGAFKALLNYRYTLWIADREAKLKCGFSSEYSPTYQQSWSIMKYKIEE